MDVDFRLNKLEVDVAKLCVKYNLKFSEIDKALILAREIVEKDKIHARDQIEIRLEGMNQFQRRMDRLESTFSTKTDLDDRIKIMEDKIEVQIRHNEADMKSLSRVVNMVVGGLLLVQFIFLVVVKFIG